MCRTSLLLVAAALLMSGCKTAEVVVDYPIAGLHVAAKFEARDPAPLIARDSPRELKVAQASSQSGAH